MADISQESIIAELLDTIQTLNQTLTDRILYLESQVFVTVRNSANKFQPNF